MLITEVRRTGDVDEAAATAGLATHRNRRHARRDPKRLRRPWTGHERTCAGPAEAEQQRGGCQAGFEKSCGHGFTSRLMGWGNVTWPPRLTSLSRRSCSPPAT